MNPKSPDPNLKETIKSPVDGVSAPQNFDISDKDAENALIEDIAAFYYDPVGFVKYTFPWGVEPLTGIYSQPDEWQLAILREIETRLPRIDQALKIAVASGHGIGKSALIAWIILWWMATRPQCQAITTANTTAQLDGKTWRELAKWHKLLICRHWFTWTATKFYADSDRETWFAKAQPWSAEKSEAFAGTHAEHVLMVFDEASAIDDAIWEVAEGAMTDKQALWVCFGNPTQNTGRFRECFGKYRHRWITQQIDSRKCAIPNKTQIDQWIEDYGEDSDFVRIRVRGVFPRASESQFIPLDVVDRAVARDYEIGEIDQFPVVLGVDPNYMGGDEFAITVRQGIHLWEQRAWREINTIEQAGCVIEMQDKYLKINNGRQPVTFIDAGGIGSGGLRDQLRAMHRQFIAVNFGGTPMNKTIYFNKRAEMWGEMRRWLDDTGSIMDCSKLRDDLISVQYGFSSKNQIQLERKEDMKKRGLSSPDRGDSLALTFAFPVGPKQRFDNFDNFAEYDRTTSNSATGY